MSIEGFPAELKKQYTPLETLGAGAMGVVFKAWDRQLGRSVAIKFVGGDENPRTRVRFLHEAAALAKLKHPNVVGVYAYGVLEERGPYIVMEFLEGRPLDRPPKGIDPLKIMLQVAGGLDEIHQAGLVHRDLKLPNIMLTEAGRAVIVDFGLVLDPKQTRVTRKGAFVGTFMVGAPEVLHLEPAVPATDWYAWGLNLFVLCEGKFPFTFPELMAVTKWHPLPAPKFRKLDPESPLAELIRRCLAEEPDERPRSRDQILEILRTERDSLPRIPGHDTEQMETMELDLPPSSEDADPSTAFHPAEIFPDKPRAPVPVLGGVVLLAGLLHWTVSGGVPAGPPPDPDEPAPFLQGYAREVSEELGRLRADEPGLIDPDPARWGATLSRLPALGRYLAWVAGGGRPETLPVELAGRLREVGGEFSTLGLPDPFRPSLHVPRWNHSEPLPAFFRKGTMAQIRLPDQLEGWLASSLEALVGAMVMHADLDRRLRNPRSPAPPGVPPSLWADRTKLFDHGLLDFVRRHSHEREFRVALQTWLRPGARRFRQALYAAGRSIREDASTRDALACIFASLGGRVSAFFYTHHQFSDLGPLLGGPPNSPAGWLLRGEMLKLQRIVRRRMTGNPVKGLRRAEIEAYERATEKGEGEMADRRQALAVSQLMLRAREDRDAGRMRSLYDRHAEVVHRAPDVLLIWMVHDLLITAMEPGSGLRLEPAEQRRLREDLLAALARNPPAAFQEARKLARRL